MMTKDIIVAAAVTFAVTFAILAAKSGIIPLLQTRRHRLARGGTLRCWDSKRHSQFLPWSRAARPTSHHPRHQCAPRRCRPAGAVDISAATARPPPSHAAPPIIDKPGQIYRLGIEFELAGFDLREVADQATP
jgi:hypothetical protein